MTFPETAVSGCPGIEILDGDDMGRKSALPPEDDEDAELTGELRLAFGRNVKAARLKANMTQADLAERCGILQHRISRIELGQINVTLGTMARIAKAFDDDVPTMLRATKGKDG